MESIFSAVCFASACFCCEGFQEVICAGYLLESEVTFLAGDVWVKFACKFPEGGTDVFR